MKEAIIKFKVESSWLTSNNLAGNEVVLMRWDGSKWNPLETSEKGKDNTYTIFEAKTPGFSSFAITGLKATPTATPAIGVTGTPAKPGETAIPTPTAVPTKKGVPGFEATVAVLVISLLAASLIKDGKRR
ncbi:MAG: PGF-pre-PGF domain-containing protein [Candidatus Methanoperedens sp.]|nr:PGF-pre-PGF domain-containing protein [Candidatus Methanoperedens sp.]